MTENNKHRSVRSLFNAQYAVSKNMGNTGTEICESQQTEKCPESLFFTCCHGGLDFSFWANKL